MALTERKLQEYVAAHLSELQSNIVNLDEFMSGLEESESAFFLKSEAGPDAFELSKHILRQGLRKNITDMSLLNLIEMEMPILDSKGAGRKPSLDILARNAEDGRLFLIEIKISSATERESVTELSAYTYGLLRKYFGLAGVDLVWVPIFMDWRTMPRSGVALHQMFSKQPCLPLRPIVEYSSEDEQVNSVKYEILDLTKDLDEPVAHSLFALTCYDCTVLSFSRAPYSYQNVIHYVGARASALGMSGFILYTESNVENYFPYPFQFFIVSLNPFKARLKARQLQLSLKSDGRKAMLANIAADLWNTHDIDMVSDTDVWREASHHEVGFDDAPVSEQPFVSLVDQAMCSENRHSILLNELEFLLKPHYGGLRDCELSCPEFSTLYNDPRFHTLNAMTSVGYYGYFQDAALARLVWEYQHIDVNGDGPVIGDMSGGPLQKISNWGYLIQFLDLMNTRCE